MISKFIDEIYFKKEVVGVDNAPRKAFPVSLPREDGNALYDVVIGTKSTTTLEIGMAYGISTLFILQALQENGGGYHTAIDPYQEKWWEGIGILNVEKVGCREMVRFIEAPSHLALPQLVQEKLHYDFIFIDGNHQFEFTLVDLFYADKLLQVGGRIMLHDTWLPSIRKVMSYICRNWNGYYEISIEHSGPNLWGLAYWRTFFQTLHTAPFDILAAYFFSLRRYNRHCVIKKIAERDTEKQDAAWACYRPF
ncbi:MAG: class I SAM-dependent methyltransferase [Candidatus Hydrogenedentes bacterium]|nr:class I SAM-dependent methyltransferase [Candidatus Hydrogenedentota bacterium]